MGPSRTIVITGATGFIGGALASACLANGDQVRALVRSEGTAATNLREAGAQVIVGDLTQTEALRELCERADVVIHCAAHMGKGDAEKSHEVNVAGTGRLLEHANGGGVKVFIFVSSISVYRGTQSITRVFTEANVPTLHPGLNNYSRSKLEGEQVVQRFCDGHALDAIIVRPTNVYGARCRPWGTRVEAFVKRFHISFGNVPFNFIHIDDLVEGMLAASASEAARNQVFNLGAEMVPLREFYEAVARAHGVNVVRLPGPIDAAIRHGVDLYARLRGQVRSTGYAIHAYYPHDKSTEIFGYAPHRRIADMGLGR